MLRELFSILRSNEPLREVGESFTKMLKLSFELTVKAGEVYFGDGPAAEGRSWIYKKDLRVNKLERKIRKRVIAHLAVQANSARATYCLLLMSLVKDVERIGDYSKNLSEAREFCPDGLPNDENVAELRKIRAGVESTFEATTEVFESSDRERSLELVQSGRELTRRCDVLLATIARGSYDAGTTTTLVLGARYYKRICSHVLNVLSSVVMPLHKLDYFDEKRMQEAV